MLFTESQLSHLTSQLDTDASQLRSASIQVDAEPLDLVRAGNALFSRSSYFRTPNGKELASLGTALGISSSGADRFGAMQSELAALPELADGARVVLGFSFSPNGPFRPEWTGFGTADAIVPAVALERSGDRSRLVVVVPRGADPNVTLRLVAGLEEPDDPPPPDPGVHTVESIPASVDWQSEVAEAVGAIEEGSFAKVVLARSVVVHAERLTSPFDLVHHLRVANPSSYVYAHAIGQAAFVGASPELLLAQDGRKIRLNPLAGSARRGKGDDDLAIGRELLESAKNRAEHAIVVDDLVSRLSDLVDRIDYPEGPSLRRMATVQHLSTEIDGTLLNGVGTFDVLRAIHPTPAVGGMPRAEALAFIDKVEGIDRGWYAGGVGWLDPRGGAQVALSLRCALMNGTTSRLYAGNGIVEESDPAAELVETRLKFQPMLDLLAVT